MNPNEPFRSGELAGSLVRLINSAAKKDREYKIMEVCGTHTMSISRTGLRSLLPKNIDLVSGPGCPVCVTSQGEIDLFFKLAEKGASITTFGDLLRIPGSRGETLAAARAEGTDVRVVYSPLDTLKFAGKEPDKLFVFLGVGFETTAPAVAFLAQEAKEKGFKNVSVLSLCKTMPKAIEMLLNDEGLKIDGFLCPGHVTAVTGISLYEPVIKAKKAAVVAGFEPVEILSAIYEIIKQTNEGDYKIVNMYKRIVPDEGNPVARDLLRRVFKPVSSAWRGLGELPESGLGFRAEYADFDAREVFQVEAATVNEIRGCRCGAVLTGRLKPTDCPLFGRLCVPENPVGPCMVSSEGTCSAYYKYGGL